MFIVLLEYTGGLSEVDALMRQHVDFLEECYRAGVFLISGRQEPRTGGVILATVPTRTELEGIMDLDPFIREGVASYEIVEFRTSLHHPVFSRFADPGTRAVKDVPED